MAPVLWPEMKSQLRNTLVVPIRPQSRTSCEIVILQQKYRPVLNPASNHGFDFASKPRSDLLRRERAADKFSYLWVTPKSRGHRQVTFVPVAEPQAVGS